MIKLSTINQIVEAILEDGELISFRDGCFRVGNDYEDEAGFYLRDWRVIGNIHENPELLGDKK